MGAGLLAADAHRQRASEALNHFNQSLNGDGGATADRPRAVDGVLPDAPAAGGAARTPTTGPVRNAHLAGQTHPHTGVPFDADGFPNFSSWRHPDVPDVRIELSGSRATDFARANAAAGLRETPAGYTWHHHQDRGLMQLIETEMHRRTGHTGGFSR
jgi:hypothetical protein